ncbi:MAG: hypothetical protein ACOJUL_03650 [Candidatus Pollutiaquabacter aromativorans]|jgi:hypothetical protein
MSASFKLIRDDKAITEKEGFATILVTSLAIVGLSVAMIRVWNVHPLVTALTMLVLAWAGRPSIRKFLGDYAQAGDACGELTFSTTALKWIKDGSGNLLHSADISELQLQYNYIQGRQFSSYDIIHNGLAQLTLQLKTNQIIQLKFLIETEAQLNALMPIWKEYDRQGIKISERMGKYAIKTVHFTTNKSPVAPK